MTLVSLVLATLVTRPDSVYDRTLTRFKNIQGIETTLEVHIAGLGTVIGKYWFQQPFRQRCKLAGSIVSEEVFANDNATILFDHMNKEYGWYPPMREISQTPPDSSQFLIYGFPYFLAKGGVSAFGSRESWVRTSPEMVRNLDCDVLNFVPKGVSAADSRLRIWVDSQGNIAQLWSAILTNSGEVKVTLNFSNTFYSPIAPDLFEFSIADGYMPSRPPKLIEPVSTGDEIILQSMKKFPNLNDVNISQSETEPLLIVFTSNDMVEESSIDWQWLASACKKAKIKFIQVCLGKKPAIKSKPWDVFWDHSGMNESSIGIASTPHFLGVREGTVVSAWQGLPDDKGKVAKGLIDPLKQ